MYKTKPYRACTMPSPGMRLNVLVFNGSLKHEPNPALSKAEIDDNCERDTRQIDTMVSIEEA